MRNISIVLLVIPLLLSACATYDPASKTIMATPFTSAEIPTEQGAAKIDVKILPNDIPLHIEYEKE